MMKRKVMLAALYVLVILMFSEVNARDNGYMYLWTTCHCTIPEETEKTRRLFISPVFEADLDVVELRETFCHETENMYGTYWGPIIVNESAKYSKINAERARRNMIINRMSNGWKIHYVDWDVISRDVPSHNMEFKRDDQPLTP